MPWLRDLQERAYRAFLLGDTNYLSPWIVSDDIPAEHRVQVYQNNARETFYKTLRTSYPVTERLVGEACFRSLARDYMRRYPSRSGNLQDFGARFPMLLEILYANSSYAYLPDVGRLEWACELARSAAHARQANLSGLSRVPASRHGELRFALDPGLHIVSSTYPILEIWRANRGDEVAEIDLTADGEHVAVFGRDDDIELHRWGSGLAAFARSLGDGLTLAEAFDYASNADTAFRPLEALTQLATLGLLCSFSLTTYDPRGTSP